MLNYGTCDYHTADRVYRLPGSTPIVHMQHMSGADKDGNHYEKDVGISNALECHNAASAAARHYASKVDKLSQMIKWQCLPTQELDDAGIKEVEEK